MPELSVAIGTAATGTAAPRVLLVNADDTLLELLQAWLGELGCRVMRSEPGGRPAMPGADLLLVDIPFPRRDAPQILQRLARSHPGVPVLVLSSSFLPGVESAGSVAKSLGVAGVLPKPLAREALAAAVRRLVDQCAAMRA